MDKSKILVSELFDELNNSTFIINELDGPHNGVLKNELAKFFDTDEEVKEYWHFELIFNDHFKNNSIKLKKEEPDYKKHIDSICRSFYNEISIDISEKDFSEGMNLLTDYIFIFKELNNNITKEIIKRSYAIVEKEAEVYLPNDFAELLIEFSRFRIGHLRVLFNSFYKIQAEAILKILEYLEMKKELCLKYPEKTRRIISRLKWEKSDTDLLELIISLHGSGSIQNVTKDLTQKDAIQAFSDFFGIEIKDQYKKLNSARNTSKEGIGFIIKLQQALVAYYKALNEKK